MVYYVVGCCLDGQMLMAYTILLPQKWTSRAPGTPGARRQHGDSDLEDEARRMLNSYQSGGSKPLTNGHPPSSHGRYSHTGIVGQHSGTTGQGSELMRVISQLDSGRFDL